MISTGSIRRKLGLTIKDYILAGHSVFTIESLRTETRFTYRVLCARESEECTSLHFVGVLVNPDNTKDYHFLGSIFDGTRYAHGKKSKIRPNAKSAVAFRWLWDNIDRLESLEGVRFHKSAYCCRCGRLLTVPESIEAGIGPECAAKVGLDHPFGKLRAGYGGQHESAPSS